MISPSQPNFAPCFARQPPAHIITDSYERFPTARRAELVSAVEIARGDRCDRQSVGPSEWVRSAMYTGRIFRACATLDLIGSIDVLTVNSFQLGESSILSIQSHSTTTYSCCHLHDVTADDMRLVQYSHFIPPRLAGQSAPIAPPRNPVSGA